LALVPFPSIEALEAGSQAAPRRKNIYETAIAKTLNGLMAKSWLASNRIAARQY
jgi:hypothetical protein